MVLYDFAIINLKYVVDAIAKIGIVKKAELKLKMYTNTGAVAVKVIDPGLASVGYTTFNTTFANTCPLTVNLLPVIVANGGVPLTTDTIVAGFFIFLSLQQLSVVVGQILLLSLVSLQIHYHNAYFITLILNLITVLTLNMQTLTVLRKLCMKKSYLPIY